MQYRRFGKTDLIVSEIGYGTWGIGGIVNGIMSYGHRDDKQSEKSLKLAYDLGVNFFDTASSYGFGHSEKLLGKLFSKNRDKVIIATKAGFLNSFSSGQNQDFCPKSIEDSIYDSLKRLKTDYIDLFQLHSPERGHLTETLFNKLDKLKDRGTIRYVGLAAKTPNNIKEILSLYKFDSVQTNFNLTDMRIIDNGAIDYIRKNKIALITRTPLVYGFLTGVFNSASKFHKTDHRNRFSKEQIDKWCSALDVYEDVFENLEENYTYAQRAIKFCLSFNEVSTVLSGMDISKYVKENLKSSNLDNLSKGDLKDIYIRYEELFKNFSMKMK